MHMLTHKCFIEGPVLSTDFEDTEVLNQYMHKTDQS